LRPNGIVASAAVSHKKGRKKRIRFDGNESPSKFMDSSNHKSKIRSPFPSGEDNESLSKLPCADHNNSENAITSDSDSYLSFIEDVKDINSVYIFDKLIGDGKFGTVFLAHPHTDSKSSVAVKIIPRGSFSHRIESELNLLKSIVHSSIIRYISAYKDKDSFYIVTEYCEGGELFNKIVEQSGIDELEAWDIMSKLLQAVKYLHDRNICHRDLKPENILFRRKENSSEIKIIDFGLSKQLKVNERMKKKLGTPYYLAPEVLEENYGKEVDMWSIGVITYVILCGYPPFYGNGAKELFRNIYQVNYEFWDEDWGFISDEAKDFISKLLVKDISSRMTIDEALWHPWIVSGLNGNTSAESTINEINSNVSDMRCNKVWRLDAVQDNSFSKSAEWWTATESYEKWLGVDRALSKEKHLELIEKTD
jgi:serine/threonine protein kinase